MRRIAIYVEGGGDSAEQRNELRKGFDGLLRAQKAAAQAKRWRWSLVPSGSRDDAYRAFVHKLQQDPPTLCVLLVDSEEAVPTRPDDAPDADARLRVAHLSGRDRWDLSACDPRQVHLMVQCMETWIVADPTALGAFYGKDFRETQLPVRLNLEEEPKLEVYAKLARATKGTTKGEYSGKNRAKIKHASELLKRVDASQVAVRCPRFKTFTEWLDEQIEQA